MKQFIFLMLFVGFFCQNSFAQNPDSVNLLLEKYGHETKEKKFKDIYLMLDGAQLIDNYSTLFFLVEHAVGKDFRLSHGFGPVIKAEMLLGDDFSTNNDPLDVRYQDLSHFGFKLREEIRGSLSSSDDIVQSYLGFGFQTNYSTFKDAPVVERFGSSANNTAYFQSRKQDVTRWKYAFYSTCGVTFLLTDHFLMGFSGGLGWQKLRIDLESPSEGARYVKNSLPSGNEDNPIFLNISARIGYRF